MTSTPEPPITAAPTAAQVNAEIRRLTAGRTWWTRRDLAELARLRGLWLEAAAREQAGGEYVTAA